MAFLVLRTFQISSAHPAKKALDYTETTGSNFSGAVARLFCI